MFLAEKANSLGYTTRPVAGCRRRSGWRRPPTSLLRGIHGRERIDEGIEGCGI
jgi:hypothetical protein